MLDARSTARRSTWLLPLAALAAACATAPTPARRADASPPPAAPRSSPGAARVVPAGPAREDRARYVPARFAGRAGRYYRQVWGIEALSVKLVESGQIVRFSWRVLDPARAAPLNDRQTQPSLVDAQAGVSLVVPTMEKIGPLRQGMSPEAGRSYWMAFSNKGRLVKRGDRVSVVIGTFRADGLVIDE